MWDRKEYGVEYWRWSINITLLQDDVTFRNQSFWFKEGTVKSKMYSILVYYMFLFSINCFLYRKDLSESDNIRRVLVTVSSNGDVLWMPPSHYESFCSFDLYKFPFDNQTCRIIFLTWSHTLPVIIIQNHSTYYNMCHDEGYISNFSGHDIDNSVMI